MREGNFARRRVHVPAKQSGIAGGMMGRAKRAARHQRLARLQQPDDTVNFGGLERFSQRERRQNVSNIVALIESKPSIEEVEAALDRKRKAAA